jgi:hypothetical protein
MLEQRRWPRSAGRSQRQLRPSAGRRGSADSLEAVLSRGVDGGSSGSRDRQVEHIRDPLLKRLAERMDILPKLGQWSGRRPRLIRS